MARFTIARHAVPVRKAHGGLSDLQHAMLYDDHPIRIFSAPTGAGKSYAFQRGVMRDGLRVLFIVPTRRLAENLAATMRRDLAADGVDEDAIARRIVIFASEDVGLADAQALPLAIATQQAVEFVGMPEARIPLAHATVYMCRAPKNRDAYDSLGAATEEIEEEKTKRVPEKLKNKHFPVNPEHVL